MKIKYKNYHVSTECTIDVDSYVIHNITNAGSSYGGGQLEDMQAQITRMAEILGRFIEAACENGMGARKLEHIVDGYKAHEVFEFTDKSS